MLIDAQLRFSDTQSLAGAAATTVSTNVIDLLAPNRNISRGWYKRIVAFVGTAFTGGTNVQVQVISSATANMASPTVLASSPVVVDATATAGYKLFDLPAPDITQRYLAVQYVTTGTHTTGTVSAEIVETTDFAPYVPSVTGY